MQKTFFSIRVSESSKIKINICYRLRNHMMDLGSLAITLGLFVLIDYVWLRVIMANFYDSQISQINGHDPATHKPTYGLVSAGCAYLLMGLAYEVFVHPVVKTSNASPFLGWTSTKLPESWARSLSFGGFFGLCIYGIYNFTNLAVLEKWAYTFTLVDVTWGVIIYTLVSYLKNYVF